MENKYTMIEKMFILDEGLKLRPYKCTADKWTIGIGNNLEVNPIPGRNIQSLHDHGISVPEALSLYHKELDKRRYIASQFSWFKGLGEERQAVILNILYIRPEAIKEWIRYKPDLIKAIDARQFKEAAEIMRTLKIARQLRNRFNRLCSQFEKGEWLDVYKNFEPKV